MKQSIIENIRQSIESIRSHFLRTVLTVMIIAFGIMALVGILTAIDSMKYYLNQNFAMMGANTFTIRNRTLRIHIGNESSKPKYYQRITYNEAMTFKESFDFPAYTSVYIYGTGIATVKYKSEKSEPNIRVMGGDENYLITAGYELDKGRLFSEVEIQYGNHVVIIGSQIASTLFKNNEDPIDKVISIGSGKYRVIGVMKEKGSSLGQSGDRSCIVPITNVRQYFSRPNMNYTINVMAINSEDMEAAEGEATGVFRIIRKVRLGEEDTFSIVKSDEIAKMLIDFMKYIRLGATLIGLITLLGAAIGLMNIMLVSVTERTREIGIRKAIGANSIAIRNQFLVESIVIAQIGGLVGIILGIAIGNVLSLVIDSAFIMPWAWIILGIILCFIVALLSGLLPATKAAKMDPIESLRYE